MMLMHCARAQLLRRRLNSVLLERRSIVVVTGCRSGVRCSATGPPPNVDAATLVRTVPPAAGGAAAPSPPPGVPPALLKLHGVMRARPDAARMYQQLIQALSDADAEASERLARQLAVAMRATASDGQPSEKTAPPHVLSDKKPRVEAAPRQSDPPQTAAKVTPENMPATDGSSSSSTPHPTPSIVAVARVTDIVFMTSGVEEGAAEAKSNAMNPPPPRRGDSTVASSSSSPSPPGEEQLGDMVLQNVMDVFFQDAAFLSAWRRLKKGLVMLFEEVLIDFVEKLSAKWELAAAPQSLSEVTNGRDTVVVDMPSLPPAMGAMLSSPSPRRGRRVVDVAVNFTPPRLRGRRRSSSSSEPPVDDSGGVAWLSATVAQLRAMRTHDAAVTNIKDDADGGYSPRSLTKRAQRVSDAALSLSARDVHGRHGDVATAHKNVPGGGRRTTSPHSLYDLFFGVGWLLAPSTTPLITLRSSPPLSSRHLDDDDDEANAAAGDEVADDPDDQVRRDVQRRLQMLHATLGATTSTTTEASTSSSKLMRREVCRDAVVHLAPQRVGVGVSEGDPMAWLPLLPFDDDDARSSAESGSGGFLGVTASRRVTKAQWDVLTTAHDELAKALLQRLVQEQGRERELFPAANEGQDDGDGDPTTVAFSVALQYPLLLSLLPFPFVIRFSVDAMERPNSEVAPTAVIQ